MNDDLFSWITKTTTGIRFPDVSDTFLLRLRKAIKKVSESKDASKPFIIMEIEKNDVILRLDVCQAFELGREFEKLKV